MQLCAIRVKRTWFPHHKCDQIALWFVSMDTKDVASLCWTMFLDQPGADWDQKQSLAFLTYWTMFFIEAPTPALFIPCSPQFLTEKYNFAKTIVVSPNRQNMEQPIWHLLEMPLQPTIKLWVHHHPQNSSFHISYNDHTICHQSKGYMEQVFVFIWP